MSEEKVELKEVEYNIAPTMDQLDSLEKKIGASQRTGFPHSFVSEEGSYTFRLRPFINSDGDFCYYRSVFATRFPGNGDKKGGFALGNNEIKDLCEKAEKSGYTKAWMWKPRKQYLILVHLYNCPKSQYMEPGSDLVLVLGYTQFKQLESYLDDLKKVGRFKERLDTSKPCVPFEMTIKPDPTKKGNIISVRDSLNPDPVALPPMRLPKDANWEGNLDNVFVKKDQNPTQEQIESLRALLHKEVEKISDRKASSMVNPETHSSSNRGHIPSNRSTVHDYSESSQEQEGD